MLRFFPNKARRVASVSLKSGSWRESDRLEFQAGDLGPARGWSRLRAAKRKQRPGNRRPGQADQRRSENERVASIRRFPLSCLLGQILLRAPPASPVSAQEASLSSSGRTG